MRRWELYNCISIHSTARVETFLFLFFFQSTAISIHSTARVETTCSNCGALLEFISIHSTARVETAMPLAGLTVVIYFNPLHREGGDG